MRGKQSQYKSIGDISYWTWNCVLNEEQTKPVVNPIKHIQIKDRLNSRISQEILEKNWSKCAKIWKSVLKTFRANWVFIFQKEKPFHYHWTKPGVNHIFDSSVINMTVHWLEKYLHILQIHAKVLNIFCKFYRIGSWLKMGFCCWLKKTIFF